MREEEEREDNSIGISRRRVAVIVIIAIILVAIVVLVSLYVGYKPFRDWADESILKKNMSQDDLNSINIENLEETSVIAYDKYIALLKGNNFKIYNSEAEQVDSITVDISKPISYNCKKYLILAEKEGKKIYFIQGDKKIWNKIIEGKIQRVCVNKNGYSAVIIEGTTYKSEIKMFDPKGEELFTIHLSQTIAMDFDISPDNKYICYGEISNSGTIINSSVKVVSVDKAKIGEEGAVLSSYEGDKGQIILKLKYSNNDKIACMFDDSISVINNGNMEKIEDFNNQENKINFMDIQITDAIIKVYEVSDESNTSSKLEIKNVLTNTINYSNINAIVKNVYTSKNQMLAINLGKEIKVFNSSGWLVKDFVSTEEIRDVVMNDIFTGIVYKDRVEILNY